MAGKYNIDLIKPTLNPGRAIELLKQQIQKIDGLIKLNHNDPEYEKWKNVTEQIIIKAFGKPHENLNAFRGDGVSFFTLGPHSDEYYQNRYLEVLKRKKSILEGFIEQLEMLGDIYKEEFDKTDIGSYDLHPKIKMVAKKLFEDGHYKDAILDSFIEVINRVKEVSKHPKVRNNRELDGDVLMNRVFGCDNNNPIIKLNDLNDSLDKAEQRGFMNLYKGICGIRDKKAHLNFVQRDPKITLEYLSLASLLMRLLDDDYLKQYNN